MDQLLRGESEVYTLERPVVARLFHLSDVETDLHTDMFGTTAAAPSARFAAAAAATQPSLAEQKRSRPGLVQSADTDNEYSPSQSRSQSGGVSAQAVRLWGLDNAPTQQDDVSSTIPVMQEITVRWESEYRPAQPAAARLFVRIDDQGVTLATTVLSDNMD